MLRSMRIAWWSCASTLTEPGCKILDTHLGSGTSRRAACDFGLEFVGCEIDKTYFVLQEKAYEEYAAQVRMEGI